MFKLPELGPPRRRGLGRVANCMCTLQYWAHVALLEQPALIIVAAAISGLEHL